MSKRICGRPSRGAIYFFKVAVEAALLAAVACDNPFQTRTPEPPTRTRGTFIIPLTPEAVLTNLRNAVLEQNLVNYSRSLADPARGGSFKYLADPAVANSRPELFMNWSLENERRYFSQLSAVLPSDSTRSLSFTPEFKPETVITLGDSAIYVGDYQLSVHHTQQSKGIARRYAGQARFTLRRDNLEEWSISRWADFSTGSTPTWSALKASFGQ
jgi:hypothetical protein